MKKVDFFILWVLIFFVSSVCASTAFGKTNSKRSRGLRMPAKLDEPIKRGEFVVQHDEPIRLGNTNKGAEQEILIVNGQKYQVVKAVEVVPTGYYSALEGQKRYALGSFEADRAMNGGGKITASGKPPKEGKTISVNPEIIPMGSKLLVEGYSGIWEAQDTGKKIKKLQRIKKENGEICLYPRIDIYFGRGDQALEKALSVNNKKPITVKILAPDFLLNE